ncbi:MAG: Pectate lyase superfamily protein, partial [Streptomyces oryziradicis]|nr:Pectate lyase superfamily protein [Actinacidiphila oryziradicis]
VTTASRIFLTVQAPGGTPSGVAYVAGRTTGTSFTVKGAAGDTSTVAWLIVEPA